MFPNLKGSFRPFTPSPPPPPPILCIYSCETHWLQPIRKFYMYCKHYNLNCAAAQ